MKQSPTERRSFLKQVLVASAAVLPFSILPKAIAQDSADQREKRPERKRPAALDAKLVKSIVIASHAKLDKVKTILQDNPKLVNATWDWGGGDYETPLNAASHMGNRKIAEYLLSQGARNEIIASAMLGESEVVKAMITADSTMADQLGAHGYTLLYHVAISGETELAEQVYSNTKYKKKSIDQSLHSSVRSGHLDMTRWVLEKRPTNINKPNAIGETPLQSALRQNNAKLAKLLRDFGAEA